MKEYYEKGLYYENGDLRGRSFFYVKAKHIFVFSYTVATSQSSSSEGVYTLILRFIKEDNNITAAKMSSKLGMSKRHVERCLAELKKKGKNERVENGRSVYWAII